MNSQKNGATSSQDATPYNNNLQVVQDTKISTVSKGLLNELKDDVTGITAINDLRKKFMVDLSQPLKPQPVALEIIGKDGPRTLGSYGGITLVTAKAKSGKTFAVSLFVSALVKDGDLAGRIRGKSINGKNVVQVFDTEQSEYHAQKVGKRIQALAGCNENLEVFKLRTEPNDKKAEIIEQIIYNTPDLAAIVVDGGKDILFDINSPEEATLASSKLLKWAEELNICIIVVLHQNKNDNNARGHYGTELKNKAEVVVNVTKDKENGVFIVEPEDCRDKEFEPIAFSIDETGLPQIVDEWISRTDSEGKPKAISPHNIPDSKHKEVLAEVFKVNKHLKYEDLITQIILAFECYGIPFKRNKAVSFAGYYTQKQWVVKDKLKDVSRYPVYFLPV